MECVGEIAQKDLFRLHEDSLIFSARVPVFDANVGVGHRHDRTAPFESAADLLKEFLNPVQLFTDYEVAQCLRHSYHKPFNWVYQF